MNAMNITSLVIGIASSLVATAIFILLSEFFRRILLPWFEDKIYQGIRIDGTWKLEKADIHPSSEDLELKISQWGNKVTGTYFHQLNKTKEYYVIKGSINNMYLMFTCEPTSNRKIDAAVGLMHITEIESVLKLRGDLLYQTNDGNVDSWNNIQFTLTNT